MQILYDGHIYSMQTAGGINRYFANIIGKLPRSFGPSLLLAQQREVNFPAHPNLKVYNYGRFPFENISWKLSIFCSLIEKRYHENLASLRHFDVIHPTYYSLLTGRELREFRAPIVLTVWDMINELCAEEFDPDGAISELKRKSISAAQAIICISENTKKDLIERYKLAERKVVVIYLASELDMSMSYGPDEVPARPYYLFVGSRFSYKNFASLLKAFANIISLQREPIICVVGPPFSDEEKKLIADLKVTDRVVHYGFTSDSHLAKLYRCSTAFVYPSLYEGFGIPPLEAMACGTPVVASNRSSIPEVAGSAARLVDPTDVVALAEQLHQVVNDG